MRPRTRRCPALILSLATLTAIGVAIAVPATASTKPGVSFRFVQSNIEVGQKVQIAYSVKHVPLHGKVLLQRAVGTAQVWKTIAKLPAGGTSFTAPTVAQGITRYRVAVTNSRGKGVANVSHSIKAFAPVALAAIVHGGQTDTVEVGGSLFRYAAAAPASSSYRLFKVTAATCRAVSLSWAYVPDSDNASRATPETVTLASEAADPVSVPVAPNATATMQAPVTGDFEGDDGQNPGSGGVYVNGTADCWTATGTTSAS